MQAPVRGVVPRSRDAKFGPVRLQANTESALDAYGLLFGRALNELGGLAAFPEAGFAQLFVTQYIRGLAMAPMLQDAILYTSESMSRHGRRRSKP